MRSFIAQCCIAGISEWIVCPGARNAPFLQILAGCQGIRQWTHYDERSAGFFALGRMMDTGLPVGVVTTSGTACAELYPAIIEAHYQGRPLLIVTADRPATFRGSGAPQAIEQLNMFGDYAPCIDLEDLSEYPEDLFDAWNYDSPLHVNICLPEPDLTASVREEDFFPEQPPMPEYDPYRLADLAQALRGKARMGLVMYIGGLDPNEQDSVRWLAEELKVPVVADATSGLREELNHQLIFDPDAILPQMPPSMILRIGDVPIGKFWRQLEHMEGIPVFSITKTGFPGLARTSSVIHGNIDAVIRSLGEIDSIGDVLNYAQASRKRKAFVDELLASYPESEPALIHAVSNFACMGNLIYLGNSSPIRQWNQYAQHIVCTDNVRANRGANGIDGQLSTFLGCSADQEESWGVFGDLTLLYDANALAMTSQLSPGKRVIVVINNQGGRIFTQFPGGCSLHPDLHRLLIQPHQNNFLHLAALWNAEYACVSSADELDIIETWENHKTYLLEIRPHDGQTQRFYQHLSQS